VATGLQTTVRRADPGLAGYDPARRQAPDHRRRVGRALPGRGA